MTHYTSIRLLKARSEDATSSAELLSQLGYPATSIEVQARLEQLAVAAGATALVAESSDGVVGLITCHMFVSVHSSAPVAWLTTLVVDSSHVGEGVGRTLVVAAEQWASANGAVRVSVTSGVQRDNAHEFYRRIGYAKSGIRFTKTL